MSSYLLYVVIAAAGYLIGSVNSAILLVRLRFRQDVRAGGSGNAGSTNVARTYGAGMGALTLLCDVLKGALAGMLGRYFAGDWGYMLGGLFCLIGHCWPLFFHFKGGKGMAVAAGALLFINWRVCAMLVVVFAITFVIWRRVSLSTIVTVVVFAPLYYLVERRTDAVFTVGAVMCVLILIRHQANIRRLAAGTEPRFQFHRKDP